MGRYKSIKIKGLFFPEFEEFFFDLLNQVVNESQLPKEEAVKKIRLKYQEVLTEYENTIAALYLENHMFNLDNFLNEHFTTIQTIAKENQQSFIPFLLYINGCTNIYESILKQIPRKRIDSTLKTNIVLYGLIVRRAQQIGDLLLEGYIDGAMIIWRSLYENCIVLLLLAIENDPILADKFYKHQVKNASKKVTSYTKYYKEFNFKQLPKSTFKNLKTNSDSAIEQYGKDFIENEFGWADDLFPGKQKASFRLLEERTEMGRYRPYYLLCSDHIHAGFNSFKHYMDGKIVILPRLIQQESDARAFIDPMQFTLSILHEVNDYILYEFSTDAEYEANILLMKKVFEMQQASFDNIDKKNKTPKKK